MKPQLLESIKPGQLPTILDSDLWSISQKFDGERLVLETGGTPKGWTRRGELRPLPNWLHDRFKNVKSKWLFDGEVINDNFYIFDLAESPSGSMTKMGWLQRRTLLAKVMESLNDSSVHLVRTYNEDKKAFLSRCKEVGSEGVVLNLHSAQYKMGKRNPGALKHKFVKDVDCFVMAVNLDGRDNMMLGMWDEANRCEVEVGRVTCLNGDGRTGGSFHPGDVVTVNILYVSKHGKLYQPTLPRKRTDKAPQECSVSQLDTLKTNKEIVEL